VSEFEAVKLCGWILRDMFDGTTPSTRPSSRAPAREAVASNGE
jgi:hypothetical protein